METLGGNISVSVNTSAKGFVLIDNILIGVGILMLIENTISIILLWKSTRLLFQIRILTLNLTISDILTGFFLILPNDLIYEKIQCELKKYSAFLFINVSLLIVTMMNLDRCFVFAFAMRYYSFITNKLITRMCCMAWILGVFLTYGMFYKTDATFGFSCVPMAYSKMNIINTSFRCITLGIVALNVVIFGYLLVKVHRGLLQNPSGETFKFSRTQFRIVRKILPLTVLFLAAFFPFMTIMTFPIIDKSTELWKKVYTPMALMVLLNSACNPVIYVWRFSEPRYHMKRLLCFWNKQMVEQIEQRHNRKTASYDIQVVNTIT